MSLQIVLITIGVILIIAVYVISIWLERGKSKSAKYGQPESNRHNIDDNSDPNNLDVDGPDQQADDIPVLDYQVNDGSLFSDELEVPTNARQSDEFQQIKSEHDTHQQDTDEQNPVSDTVDDIDSPEKIEDADEIPDERVDLKNEPQLTQGGQPETEQAFPDVVKSAAASNYIYPNIDGFERVSQIDYWVKLQGARDVGRESVLAQYREAKSALTKHSRILGLKIPKKNWCDLEKESEDARFGDIIVTIQLADQKGPVSETELAKF